MIKLFSYCRQVQLDSSASNFCGLQHLFFMAQKLFKEVGALEKLSIFVADEAKPASFSSDGGFLVQPCFDKSYTAPSQKASDMVDEELWSRYCLLLSERIWPSMVKCLIVGKTCLEHKASQVQVLMSSVTMQVCFFSSFRKCFVFVLYSGVLYIYHN